MWLERILVLLALQMVASNTLARYDQQSSEVYEIKEDKETNTVQFIYPKSTAPKLREIVYYHIIEKPYSDAKSEGTVQDVVAEAETERMPTNTHGYQFLDNLFVDYSIASTEASKTEAPADYEYIYDEAQVNSEPAQDMSQNTPTAADTAVPEETIAEEIAYPEETSVYEEEGNPEVTYDIENQDNSNDETSVHTSDSIEGSNFEVIAEENTTPDNTYANEDTNEENSEINEETEKVSDEPQYVADVESLETTEVPEEDKLKVEDVLKKLKARHQLFGSPELLRERLLKMRSLLPFASTDGIESRPAMMSARRRRSLRRAKRKARRAKRAVTYIFPQGYPYAERLYQEPSESDVPPPAPTLPPMDLGSLPDYMRTNTEPVPPELNADSESSFVPPPNTYGMKLRGNDGYVWNTLYGSATEASTDGNVEPSSESYTEEVIEETTLEPESPNYDEESTPSVEAAYPEEIIPDEEYGSDQPAEIIPDVVPGEGETVDDGEQTQEAAVDEQGQFVDETPTEIVPGDQTEESGDEAPVTDSADLSYMRKRLQEIIDLLPEDLAKEGSVVEGEPKSDVPAEGIAEELPTLPDETAEVVPEETGEEALPEGIVPEPLPGDQVAEEGSTEGHQPGTYGMSLAGGEGEVWNDITGVRFYVGSNDPLLDFDNFDMGTFDINNPAAAVAVPVNEYDMTTKGPVTYHDIPETSTDNIASGDEVINVDEMIGDEDSANVDKGPDSGILNMTSDLNHELTVNNSVLHEQFLVWIKEWSIVYTEFLSDFIDKSVKTALEKYKTEELSKSGDILETENTKLYLNGEEVPVTKEVNVLLEGIPEDLLKRRKPEVPEPISTITADDMYGTALNKGDVYNVYIFFNEEQGKQILEQLKPSLSELDKEDFDEKSTLNPEIEEPVDSIVEDPDYVPEDEGQETIAEDGSFSDAAAEELPAYEEIPEEIEGEMAEELPAPEVVDEQVPEEQPEFEGVPEIVEGEPEIIEGEPEIVEGEPEIVEGEPEIVEGEPEIVEGEPEIVEGEPEIVEGEPEIVEGEPEIVEGEPEIVEAEPEVLEGEPEIVEGEPEIVEGEPEIVEEEPEVIEGEPEIVETEPEVVEGEPKIVEGEPEMAEGETETMEAEIVEGEPEIVEGEPEIVEGEPEIIEGEPEMVEGEPEEPEIVEGEPEVVEGEPEVIEGEPEIVEGEPENVEGEPEIVEPEPEVVEEEPEIVEGEPEIMEGEPEIVEAEPEAVEGEPEIVEAEPEIAEGEPEIVEGAPEVVEEEAKLLEEDPEAVESEPVVDERVPESTDGDLAAEELPSDAEAEPELAEEEVIEPEAAEEMVPDVEAEGTETENGEEAVEAVEGEGIVPEDEGLAEDDTLSEDELTEPEAVEEM